MAKNAKTTKRKITKQVVDGVAHIHASFNNTIITITAVSYTHLRAHET
mgnify:CR=1 FL=1